MPQICLILTAIASSCGQNKLNTFSFWEVFGNFKKRKKNLKRFSQFGYLNFSNSESQKRRQKCLCKYNNNNELNFRSKLSRQELVKNISLKLGFCWNGKFANQKSYHNHFVHDSIVKWKQKRKFSMGKLCELKWLCQMKCQSIWANSNS